MSGDRRGLNPHLLVHSEACTPVHHGHRASSPSWSRTNITGFKGRFTTVDRGMNCDAAVGAEGIEPPSAVCRTTALPLDEAPVVGAAPIKPWRRDSESPGNRTLFVRVRAGCFASKAWNSCVRAAGGDRTHADRFKRPVPVPSGASGDREFVHRSGIEPG